MQTLTDASYNAAETAREMGAYSTWGQGQTAPKAWKDAGCIHPSLAGATMVCARPTSLMLIIL
jgi:poly [ADP-ribose] polymerase